MTNVEQQQSSPIPEPQPLIDNQLVPELSLADDTAAPTADTATITTTNPPSAHDPPLGRHAYFLRPSTTNTAHTGSSSSSSSSCPSVAATNNHEDPNPPLARAFLLPTDAIDEEDEEDVEDEDDDYYLLDEATSDILDIANRTFIATCQKFARQNYPEYRRRAAYSFLENWLLHSMYSKSQQILLGIPHIHPTVLLAGDDFMFTPLLQPQHPPYGDEVEQMQFDYDEEEEEDEEEQEEDEEDDGENNPRDVLMVTARAPDVVDENTWMTGSLSDQQQQQQQLSQHQPQGVQMQMLSPGNQATAIAQHHVQAAARNDNNDADHQNNYSIQEEERHRPDTLEDTCEDVETGFTMSPEMIHWYRTARFSQARPPSTIFEFEDKGKEVQQQNTPDDGGEYQPLSEMLADDKNGSEHQQRTDSVVIPMPAQHHAYGTVKNREDIENEEDEEDEENDIATTGLAAFVGIMLDALHSVARDKDYQDGRGTLHQFWHFVGAVFHIWRLLFFCAETLLADLFAPVSYSRHTQPLQKLKIPPRHE